MKNIEGIFIPTEDRIRSIIKELITPQFEEIKNLIAQENKPKKLTYTVDEVTKELNVIRLAIYNYIKSGKIKSFKVGRNHIIKAEELENSQSEVKSYKYRR